MVFWKAPYVIITVMFCTATRQDAYLTVIIHPTIHLASRHNQWPGKPSEGPANKSSWRWHKWVSVERFTKRNSISNLAGIGEDRRVKILLQVILFPLPLWSWMTWYLGSYEPTFCRRISFFPSRKYKLLTLNAKKQDGVMHTSGLIGTSSSASGRAESMNKTIKCFRAERD